MENIKKCMPDNVRTRDEYFQYLKDIGYYKWNNPSKIPERIKEDWCPEETAQEVLVQYLRAKRYEMCVGWFEDGRWWNNDEIITYTIVAWRRLPKKYKPKIHWEFKYWLEKATGEAHIEGVDVYGLTYEATGIMGGGEIVEVNEVNVC